ncbi:MAG TPA: retroviral-like aspartic protease family protein [Steroidobacteraceae bacterium]|nr:retroviral-like aspartic protease family protein [Steroidobacteraceae bacterium]
MRVSWSRRRVLTEGVLSVTVALSLPRAFARQRTDHPPSLARTPRSAAASPSAAGSGAVVATTAMGGRLTTAVRINGFGPYHFLVDTGAERTVIADDLARNLALPRGPDVMVEGIVRTEREGLVDIRELEMGTLICPRLQVPALPRSMLNADGYLGLDVLDDRRVVFDFAARTLTITRPRGFFSEFWTRFMGGGADDVRVPTLGDSGRLRSTDCLIDGVHADAFIDTGAQMSVINHALYRQLQRRKAGQILPTSQILTGVTGGSIVGATTLLEMVRVGQLVMTFTTAVIADLPVFKVWGLTGEPALLIGMDCLRRCARVTIDYRRKELRFEIASAHLPQPLEAGLPRPLAG